jgi:glyoxylase-like metal-dependent hydrolase (beta-lactamase superfamily II)/8-oxo-dGTP pyrophosphatase MutT (NUDIX family)
MGGWHAFPGGRLSPEDGAVPVTGSLDGIDAYNVSGRSAPHPACALRELFEETGILAVLGTLPSVAEIDRARSQLLLEELDFGEWLRSHGLSLDASRLRFAGRWVTPPLSPIRFDATFFLLGWGPTEAGQPTVIPGELDSGEWIRADEALRRWDAGDVLLAQPTLETIRVLAEHGPEGRDRLWRSQAHEPNSPHAIEFRPGIRVIPLQTRTLPPATHTNAMLLGGSELVAIDPGAPWPEGQGRLSEIINEQAQRGGGRLCAIWLTHHHEDHVAGAEALRREYDVPMWAHEATAARLVETGLRIDRRFEGGELVTLAGSPELRIRILHTPGHASGHLCFFEERTRTLLCGDMLSGFGTVVINPPDGSMIEYLESLQELADLGARVILPSHGTMMRNAPEALAAARQHRLWREERVFDAWLSGRRQPEAMLDAVYDELDPRAKPLAVRQVVAHLERLEAVGRISPLPAEVRALIGRA